MIIRKENKNDYINIFNFVKTAFETAKVKDGDEQDFVDRIRASKDYIPELAFVAEENGEIIGHIMFSKTYVQNNNKRFEALMLAPLAVRLDYRCRGIGGSLIKAGFEKAKKMGYTAVFLAGDSKYYSRFGFEPTIKHNIKCSLDIPEDLYENIMVCELKPGALRGISGIVKFTT